MARALPFSLIPLVIAGIVFLLQLLPFPGIILMVMLAAMWPIALVNASMIGIAAEAALGRVYRFWLIVPVAFYGIYAACMIAERLEFAALVDEIDAHNAGVTIPFDPERHALLHDNTGSAIGPQNWDVPVVYAKNDVATRSTRIIEGKLCDELIDEPELGFAGIKTGTVRDRIGRNRTEDERYCTLSIPKDAPDKPVFTISRTQTKTTRGTMSLRVAEYLVTSPEGKQWRIKGGTASLLKWVPMPIAGCALNSGGPSWNCFAGFLRTNAPILSGKDRYGREVKALASAMGIEPLTRASRTASDSKKTRQVVDQILAAEHESQIAALDAMIADPLVRQEIGLWSIKWRPDLIAPRADAMVAALESVRRNERRTLIEYNALVERERQEQAQAAQELAEAQETASRNGLPPAISISPARSRLPPMPDATGAGQEIASVLENAPASDIRRLGARIVALFDLEQPEDWLWKREYLLRRIGEAGPVASPILLQRVAATTENGGAGIEGWCRMGSKAPQAGQAMLLELWNDKVLAEDRAEDFIVAMLRTETALPGPGSIDPARYESLVSTFDGITPESSSDVCDGKEELQRREEAERQRRISEALRETDEWPEKRRRRRETRP